MDNTQLTQKQELLLMKALDGECSLWEDLRVNWLLKNSGEARRFIDSWAKVQAETVAELTAHSPSDLDLWPRITQRIDQEKRAEMFLGKRTFRPERRWAGHSWVSNPLWGLGGASVAVALLTLMILPRNGGWRNREPGIAGDNNIKYGESLAPVSLSNRQGQSPVESIDRPRILEPHARVPQAIEVDWMRSDGRLKVIPLPSGQAGVIWVKRRNGTLVGVPSQVLQARKPLPFLAGKPVPDGLNTGN